MATSTSNDAISQELANSLKSRLDGNPRPSRRDLARLTNDGDPDGGTSTPIPADAPPSVVATKEARQEVRQRAKRRLFPSIEYEPRVSYFDKDSTHHDFRGFFVLFWVGLGIMVITTMLRNFIDHGYPLRFRQWDTFTANIWELAVAEAFMIASTFINVPLNLLYKDSRGLFNWSIAGRFLQSVYQAAFLSVWTLLPYWLDWRWTAQVFFSLHMLALLMKVHSYGFYNAHLANTLRRLNDLDKMRDDKILKTDTPVSYPSAGSDPNAGQITPEEDEQTTLTSSVSGLRNELAHELVSDLGNVTYPQNVTMANYLDFLCCPTLCYELEYPRRPTRSYMELFYKTLALFGCIFLLTVIVEEYMLPALDAAEIRVQHRKGIQDGLLIFAETVSRLLYPFIFVFLLVFIAIFEYLCGAFAEITRFADRHFYSDWWNFSSDWLEFSQEWNVPVHHFLRRHVYCASRAAGLNRTNAILLTFFVSALGHELILIGITRKVRFYAFGALCLQMPLVLIQRSRWFRGRKLLNNVIFWCCMILGLSMICTAYVNF